MTIKHYYYFLSLMLTCITVLTGAFLLSIPPDAVAETSVVLPSTAVTILSSCSMTANIDTPHAATLMGNTYSGDNENYPNGIGKTTITAFCNNAGGFAIYAVGYSGTPATYGNNTLIGVNTGLTISTGTATSGETSQWAMKVSKVTDATAYNPQNLTITNGYDDYHAVPEKYTKVADFSTTIDSTLGSKITTTYAAFVSRTQIADTYVGQVKYTLVHPQSAVAPSILTDYGIIYLQDFAGFTSEQIATIKGKLDVGERFVLIDSRDGNAYHIAKLADGNIWLLDNLSLDLTNRAVADILSSDNTNASDTSLNYLRNGGGTESDKYPILGLNYTDWTIWRSYSAPLVNAAYKNTTYSGDLISEATTWKYGIYYNYCAATAGSYCYGNGDSQGTSTGNATEDLCPKGWRMPTGNTGGEYRQLYLQYNSSAADYRAALRLPLSGIVEDGIITEQQSTGRWWTSTRRDNGYMYIVRVAVDGSNVTTADVTRSYWRSRGYSIRCILQS